jgi:hypothetical protein
MLLVSVYVQFDPWGRMGNRMFQYTFGYILAQQKQCSLFSEGLPNFNIQNNFKTLPENSIRTSSYGKNYVDIEELLKTDKDVIIDSFVQKASYYTPHQETLREVFNIQENKLDTNNQLVVHIRETDYKDINCFLGYEFYKHLIEQSGFTDVVIVTDNSNCETVQKLVAEGCKLHTEGYVNRFEHISDDRGMSDFNFLLYSNNIAISQSSFSWWSAFLGIHNKIFFPFPDKKGMWKTVPDTDDIDLFFNFDKSYKVIL